MGEFMMARFWRSGTATATRSRLRGHRCRHHGGGDRAGLRHSLRRSSWGHRGLAARPDAVAMPAQAM